MPKVNDYIGPYQLINRLGKGTFGEVWLAQIENSKNPPVALKLPNDPELDFDALLQEAIVWARAGQHPNVVEFLAARVFDQQAVIVSEYVPDGSLEQWLKQNGGRAPTADVAVEMTRGILDGLEHLHSKRIIHRDIKPANILMHGATPRLADFGHSRVLASTMHSSIVAGTPAYMAPEAFEAVRDEQTDLWSVGVLLYQMLAGRMPFPQRDQPSLIKAILMAEPQPLPTDLPGWLRQAVVTAMSKETAERYQSAAQMRAALLQSAAQPTRQTRKIDDPVKLPNIPQPEPQPEPIVRPSSRPEPQVEPPTIQHGNVMVDLSPKPEPPREVQSRQDSKAISPPKPQPTPAQPSGLRPVIKWGGAGLAAIVLAVATYVGMKTSTTVPPNSFDSPDNTQPSPTLSSPINAPPSPSPSLSVNTLPLPDLGDEFTENLNGVKLKMKRVLGGEFLMGSLNDELGRFKDEVPQHRVTVQSFYIGKTEVTQAQWKAVMDGNNPSNFKGDDLPVENVSWDDATKFCQKLSAMTGKSYRLPSEAEWEYACRAGTTGAYAGDLDEMAWYSKNSGGKTHPVGQKQPNSLGLFDMHGNVWEWCEDVYHDRYNGAPKDGSAWLSERDSGLRVLRGGSWGEFNIHRSASRGRNVRGYIDHLDGVRVVLSSRTR